jgi:hypothetical protein
MLQYIGGKTYCNTTANNGFPFLGYFRAFPKQSFTDEEGNFWEHVSKRTRKFLLQQRGTNVRVEGFENKELDGILIPDVCFCSIKELKAHLKEVGYPSFTSMELFLERQLQA